MKKSLIIFGFICTIYILGCFNLALANPEAQVIKNLSSMPLAFTENRGQWDEDILFRVSANGATLWFTNDGAFYQFTRGIQGIDIGPNESIISANPFDNISPDSIESLCIKASFVGANTNPRVVGSGVLDYKCNYFIGNDSKEWRTDITSYTSITYRDIYPGIDLKYYGNVKHMEYDFIVSPGADPSQICIHYDGANSISVNNNNELVVETKWGSIVERKPLVYQIQDGKSVPIGCAYSMIGENRFSFELEDSYNSEFALVIDPVLTYSTFLGGSGLDRAYDIASDAQGNAYIVGLTLSSDFPSLNPLQGTYAGNGDAFITKLNSDGNALIYSTFLGGGAADTGISIAIDTDANIYITGRTASSNFPTVNPMQGTIGGSEDSFIAKLNSTGDALIFSTYLGGSNNDRASGIVIDFDLNVYVTGWTSSTDFPIENPIQGTYGGNNDAYILKLNESGASLIYSTYLGGNSDDRASSIAVDDEGNAYITGNTSSSNFPTHNAYQGTFGGSWDIILAKIDNLGNSLIYSTYLGSTNGETGWDIDINADHQAIITGYTKTNTFPTENPVQSEYGGGDYDAIVTMFNSGGNGIIFSSYLGGGGSDVGRGIAVDENGILCITGDTYSTDFPVVDALQTSSAGGSDVFVTQIDPVNSIMQFSTYLGGNNNEYGVKITEGLIGNPIICGRTASPDFPTLSAYDYSYNGGPIDAFVANLSLSDAGICDDFDGLFCDDFEIYDDVSDPSFQATWQPSNVNEIGSIDIVSVMTGNGLSVSIPAEEFQRVTTIETFPFVRTVECEVMNPDFGLSNDGSLELYGAIFHPYWHEASGTQVYMQYVPHTNEFRFTYSGGPGEYHTCGSDIVITEGQWYKMKVEMTETDVSAYYDLGDGYQLLCVLSHNLPLLDGAVQLGQQGFDAAEAIFDNVTVTVPSICDDFNGIFCDDFNDGVITNWQTLTGACSWVESGGNLSTSNSGMEQWCIQTIGDQSWRNYILEADVRGNTGVDKVLVFRIQDENNFYAVNLRSDYPSPGIDQITFDKMVDGIYHADEAVEDWPSENGSWYHLKIACADNSFKIYVDGSPALEHTDTDDIYYTGGVGIACWTGYYGECDISFDNVSVADPFPRIEITDATGEYAGEFQTITGSITDMFGDPYPVNYGDFGVEDAISMQTSLVDVTPDGYFQHTVSTPAIWEGDFLFLFIISTPNGIIRHPFIFPVLPNQTPSAVMSPYTTTLQIGTVEELDNATDAYAIRTPNSSLPAKLNNLVQRGAGYWNDAMGIIATSWRRQANQGLSKLLFSNVGAEKEKCISSGWHAGSCVKVALAYAYNAYGTITQLTEDYINEVGNTLYENDQITECGHAQWNLASESAEWVSVIISLDAGSWLETASSVLELISQGAETEIGSEYDEFWDACDIGERNEGAAFLLRHFTSEFENRGVVAGMIKVFQEAFVIRGLSPISIIVTDQSGRKVGRDVNEIPRANYARIDPDFDGDYEEIIIIPIDSIGDIQIRIIPDSTASPDDSFSVIVDYTYYNEPVILIENEVIENVPTIPISLSAFENLSPDSFDLVSPNLDFVEENSSIEFVWFQTADQNQNHNVLYDLIISNDSTFSESLTIYNLIDTSYILTDTPPSDSLNLKYYWRIRAHDLWGASTFSNQVYSFSISYICGDANNDDSINIFDITHIISYLYLSDPSPYPLDAADVNNDDVVNIFDITYLIAYLYLDGPDPTCD